ncbi:MAG: hypothetical protein GEU83_10515 [Pseudonocardiaceae bacterium]|nr:hypothetical protein [Pseudonocardiaceae bacterium]
MSHANDRNTGPVPICHRDRTKTLLAAAIEHHLTDQGQPPDRPMEAPWDVWWACYRVQRTAAEFSLDPRRAKARCEVCATDAGRLASCAPPEHPDRMVKRRCSCLLTWARSMRQPATDIAWPAWRLTVAMVKPGSDPIAVRELLAESHTVLADTQQSLAPADVRRLYPDAYGRAYVARRDDYLTSAPVTVFVLLASPWAVGKAKDIKLGVRRHLGDGDVLRNHLHMPDSPGDAFADLDHLAGTETFIRLYERYERDRAADRLARYRALLEQPDPRHRPG